MQKIVIALMALAILISPVFIHPAMAGFSSISLLGFYGKCYNADWTVGGGQRPGSCSIQGDFDIQTSGLMCTNPDGSDVRVGQGGLSTVVTVTTPDTEIIDRNGHAVVTNRFPWSVEEFASAEFADICRYWSTVPPSADNTVCDPQAAFENFYQVSAADCVNPNWTPTAYLIGSLIVSGDIVCDGEVSRSSAQAFCWTDQSYTSWPVSPAGPVAYTCNVNPVANNDAYSFSASRDGSLVVAASGVLGNDTDNEGDLLTATQTTATSNGTVSLSGDGSFTYTPNAGFIGTDGFGYTASDAHLPSEEAWVTITVKR